MRAHSRSPEVHQPTSVKEALGLLGPSVSPLAGGTWIMRSHLRGEQLASAYVSLHGIAGLSEFIPGNPTLVGSLVTHAKLAYFDGVPRALADAARASAFPAVRSVATVGGNICARPFPEADLVPAMLALDAEVEVATAGGSSWLPLRDYVSTRNERSTAELILRVKLPAPQNRISTYERLTVRASAEYPIAGVAVALDLARNRVIESARVVVGSVEETAVQWRAAEDALRGQFLSSEVADRCSRVSPGEFKAREGLDAPAWYRLAVLPALLTRAVDRLAQLQAN